MSTSTLHGIPSALLWAAAALGLAACATHPVGPDYELPDQATINRPAAQAAFAEAGAASGAASGRATPFDREPLPPHWWRLYRDPALDHLIAEALAHNTDLRVAAASLERERALEAEVGAATKPTATLGGGPVFGHQSGLDYLQPGYVPPDQWAYAVEGGISYNVDIVGRIRRSIEAARDNGEAAQAGFDLARVNVVAATTRAYADACGAALILESARHSVQLQQESLDVSNRLQQAGRVGAIDTARAQGQLEQLKAAIAPLQARRQAALYRLATLTGVAPREFSSDAASCTMPPLVAGSIPVGDGAALLRRRPDVRQAERMLAAATANIGVATADLYPRVTLGLSASSVGLGNDFGGRDAFAWSLGPLISWTLPNTGAVQARIAASQASTRMALAKFDGTVLQALRETETALNAYARELDRHAALQAARDASATVAEQARSLYRNGRTNYLDSLDAERALAGSEAALAASSTALADDQVTLFLALGGGWEPDAVAAR